MKAFTLTAFATHAVTVTVVTLKTVAMNTVTVVTLKSYCNSGGCHVYNENFYTER